MDDEDTVKAAPVTRLRRRLSVEQTDEAKSSSAPNTPTKKRGGRRAAKPELDLIDENAPENGTPKNLPKKTNIKDIELEEKPVTPSRRSARIRSTSSIVLETTQAIDSPRAKRATRRASQAGSDNEAPITPARLTRRARKDSAKTDKAEPPSTSKAIEPITEVPIAKVIVEEADTSSQKSHNSDISIEHRQSPSGLRKSPRLSLKKNKSSDAMESQPPFAVSAEPQSTNKALVPVVVINEKDLVTSLLMLQSENNKSVEQNQSPSGFQRSPQLSVKKSKSNHVTEATEKNYNELKELETNETTDLTATNENEMLINEKDLVTSLLMLQSENNKSIEQNQSPSGFQRSPQLSLKKSKINHVKEANEKNDNELKELETNETIDLTATNENEMCKSEELNNSNKENVASSEKLPTNVSPDVIINERPLHNKNKINLSSSAVLDMQTQSTKYKRQRSKSWSTVNNPVENDNKCDIDSESIKRNKRISNNSKESLRLEKKIDASNNINEKNTLDKSVDKVHNIDVIDSPNRKIILQSASVENHDISNTSALFNQNPGNMQVSVYIEDDYNPKKISNHREDEDQCVPIIQSHLVSQETQPQLETETNIFNLGVVNNKTYADNEIGNKNDSCEPMDIDETLPDNLNSGKSLLETQNLTVNKIEMNNSGNKGEETRESLLNINSSQVHDKTSNENKSTLVLSHIKDISNENHDLQSPKSSTEKNLPNSEDALNVTQDNDVNKNKIAPNYSTSTPLLQKGLMKHVIQVNNSGITSNNTSNIDQSSNNSKINTNKSRNSSCDDSETENDSSEQKGSFVNDEAEEASGDYESGDSKDEEEELYERENEIVEKGETLSSGDDFSDDSDYEKDSFVVSSDEVDNELLSGSGDALSMSDNELKMSSKSKKKYDERKKKEQKLASRQMYESRHKLSYISNKSELMKAKKNRAVLESSDSENENIIITNKKNRRLRLDSSHEVSINKSSENNSGTPINKNLSKSITEEVEMTVIGDNMAEENDPLENIQVEPKTPQKEEGNKTIQFIDPEDSDKIDDDSNKSQIIDPLDESNSSQSSDSNDNLHIQNYDSILNDLNKSMKTRKDKGDISLNLNKKNKKKSERIVDQLNLTEIKSKKKKDNSELENSYNSLNDRSNKSQNDTLDQSVSKKASHNNQKDHNSSLNSIAKISMSKNENNNKNSDSELSDSIDLHLLFSEDSNTSEDTNTNHKTNELNNEDHFIPLKESQGKTDILEISGCSVASTENASKKNKKPKVLNESEKETIEDTEVQFFVDTFGTHKNASKKKNERASTVEDEGAADKSIDKSVVKTPKSEKKKNKRISKSQAEEYKSENSVSDALKEITNKSALEAQEKQTDVNVIDTSFNAQNKSLTKTPKSDKKKKRLSDTRDAEQTGEKSDSDALNEITNKSALEAQEKRNDDNVIDTSFNAQNKSSTKTPKSDKKKKRLSETQDTEETGAAYKIIDQCVVKTPKSDKKKTKRMSESQAEKQKCENSNTDAPMEVTKNSVTDTEGRQIDIEQVTNTSLNKSITKTPKVDKKKNRPSETQPIEQIDDNSDSDAPMEVKNKSETEAQENHINIYNVIDTSLNAKNKSLTKTKSNKKKNKQIAPTDKSIKNSDVKTSDKKKSKMIESQSEEQTHHTRFTENATETEEEIVNSKKRKRKSSLNQMEQKSNVEGSLNTPKPNINVSIALTGQNKKRKISHNIDNSEKFDQDLSSSIKKTKKRKEREDDEANILEKVLTVDNKIRVPRLPKSLLNKLEEKPKKNLKVTTKPKVISTTNFVVEESKAKRTKPSNYLEESIYLNDEETSESKRLKHIKNPKVLPFLPTVSSSNSGYTTNFKINVLPKEIKFVAKSSNTNNFKNDFLENKKLKRLGTYDLYKRNRNIKMSKF